MPERLAQGRVDEAELFSRAQALRRMGGHREEAIALFEQYLGTEDPRRKDDAEKALAELRTPAATGDEAADAATARTIFMHGAQLYDKRDYAHAYDEFTRAGELSPRPGTLFSRAQAARRMGDAALASSLYKDYIGTPGATRAEEAQIYLDLLTTHGAAP